MVHELAREILLQANILAEEAVNSSKAELRLWTWRCKHHVQTNTEFQMRWSIHKTMKGSLVVVKADGFSFPE